MKLLFYTKLCSKVANTPLQASQQYMSRQISFLPKWLLIRQDNQSTTEKPLTGFLCNNNKTKSAVNCSAMG